MAVTKVPQGAEMSIKVQAGVTSTGAPAYKTLRFSSVRASAADAVAGLQSYPVMFIERIDTGNLVND